MAAGGHFGWPKITFDRISHHFRSIRNFNFFSFSTKWLPAAVLDDQKSRSIAFLAISDQYATFIFFHKMAANGHFGITFDNFSSFQINTQLLLLFFHKMAAGGHFGWPKITFECISGHFRSIRNFFFFFFFQNGHRPPFWKSLLGHFGWPKITFDRISRHFIFIQFFFKMAASGHFGSPICAKNNRVLPLCVINGYAKYEVDRWICDTVRDATSFLSIFIQNGRQRPFCFSDWWQKS